MLSKQVAAALAAAAITYPTVSAEAHQPKRSTFIRENSAINQ